VHCLSIGNGQSLWTFKTRGDVDSSPVICGSAVVAASKDGRVYVLDLETGEMVWNYEIGAPISGSPAVAAAMIIIGAEDGRVYAFGVR
jgi:outer membrane protein assembly factor BamB